MNIKKIHKDFLHGEGLPASILPTGIAWKDMQQRLNEELPERGGVINSINDKDTSFRSRVIKGSALLLLLLLTGMAIQETNNKTGKGIKNISQAKENNSSSVLEKTGNDAPDDENITENRKEQVRNDDNNIDASISVTDMPSVNSQLTPSGKKSRDVSDLNVTNSKTILRKNNRTSAISRSNSSSKPSHKNTSTKRNTKKASSRNSQPTFTSPTTGYNNEPGKTGMQNDQQARVAMDTTNEFSSSRNLNEVVTKKPDSLQTAKIPELEQPGKEYSDIEGGLVWTLQLPIGSTGNYFSGPTAASQPYRILLPGVWLNFRIGRSAFTTEMNPLASGVLPSKSFGTFTSLERVVDTVITTTQTKTLRKTFGMSLSLGYSYNISEKWWLGGSIQVYWWKKGIAVTSGEEIKQVVGNPNQTKRQFNDVYSMPGNERDYFTKLQMISSLELSYKMKSSQAVFRIGVTPLSFAKNEGPGNPFRADLLYKISLFNIKKAKPNY